MVFPTALRVLKEHGDQACRSGRYADAASSYSSLLSLLDGQTDVPIEAKANVFANRALCYEMQRDWEKAFEDASVAVAMNPAYVKGWYRLGRALTGLKLAQESLSAFETAAELDGLTSSARGLDGNGVNPTLEAALRAAHTNRNLRPAFGAIAKEHKALQMRAREVLAQYQAKAASLIRLAEPPNAARDSTQGPAQQASSWAGLASMAKATSEQPAPAPATNGAHCPQPHPAPAPQPQPAATPPQPQPIAQLPPRAGSGAPGAGPQNTGNSAVPDPAVPELSAGAEAAEAAKAQGTTLYQAGDWGGALKAYKEAVELAPGCGVYRANCAAAALMLGQYREAAADAAAAAELSTGTAAAARAHLRAAKAHLIMGHFAEAKSHYKQAGESASAADMATLATVQNNLQKGEALLETDARMAQWHADTAARAVTPAPEPVLFLRCHALLRQGKHAEAIAQSRALTVEGRRTPEVLAVQANAQYAAGNAELAQRLYQEVLRQDPDHVASGRALKWLRTILAAKEAGNAAFKARRWREAHDQYSAALAQQAARQGNQAFFAQCFANRAAAALELGRAEEACADCGAALGLDPDYTRAHARRAKAYQALGRHEEAVRDLERVKQLDAAYPGLAELLRHAKMELKKAQRVDYYALLEVEASASEYDIKKAYKRAALKWHPDKAPAGERDAAETKFKQVTAAHAILSDPGKRQKYDAGWSEEEIEQGCQAGCGMGGMGGVDLNDVLAAMMAARGAGGAFGGAFGGMPGGFAHGMGGASPFPGRRH